MTGSLESGAALPFGNGSQILKDLIELRKKIGGLKAEKKNGVSFAVKSAKDLLIRLRNAADELGMPVAGGIVRSETTQLGPIQIFGKDGIGCHTTVTVRFMSADGSYIDFCGSGHGTSNDDKAGGKAHTYAWKAAIINALCLPDKEMVDTDDESNPVTNVVKNSTFKKKEWKRS